MGTAVTPQQLKCPACGRWLAEVADYARVVCAGCGAEVTYKSREERKRGPVVTPVPRQQVS
jgi:predicted RNA-binding Zn-ribbon protein involved in translation (DUF1610 family)